MPKVSVELGGFVIDPDAQYSRLPVPGEEIILRDAVTIQHYRVEAVEERDVLEGGRTVRKTFVIVSQL
jgi:hypothetical protein